ncbi:MAG: hypothetical protein IPG87_19705 [Saprospiraceae bacterium]|nr:hypothetical protein [Candidatus Vicinibacter affinis]
MKWRWEAEWRQGDGVQWQVPQKYTVLLLVCLFDSNLEKQSPRLLTPPPIHQHLTPTNLCLQGISFIDRQTAQIDQSVMASIGLLQSASTLDQTPKWTSQRQSRK